MNRILSTALLVGLLAGTQGISDCQAAFVDSPKMGSAVVYSHQTVTPGLHEFAPLGPAPHSLLVTPHALVAGTVTAPRSNTIFGVVPSAALRSNTIFGVAPAPAPRAALGFTVTRDQQALFPTFNPHFSPSSEGDNRLLVW